MMMIMTKGKSVVLTGINFEQRKETCLFVLERQCACAMNNLYLQQLGNKSLF